MNYKLDEHGKFSEDNDLISSIDEWYDNDEFDKIINGILEVPREIWSTDLRRYLISAYNNLEEFHKSWEELEQLKPLCNTPELMAAYHYLSGYIYYKQDREMMAVLCYQRGKEVDPEDESGRDFDSLIKDCRGYIDDELKRLKRLSERINKDVKEACSATPEEDKYELTEEQFTMLLGFLSGIRKIPGTDRALLFDEYFLKLKGKEKKAALDMFENFYGVHDRESFREFFTGYEGCNLSGMYSDIPPYLAGKPNFDVNELNDEGLQAFTNSAEFVKQFVQYLPDAGVLAWDICEKVGFARLAWGCGLIGNTDYCTIMIMLTDQARENFSSFEEYMRSLAFGCGVYMFHTDGWAIVSAIEFMENMMPFLLNGDLVDAKWKSEED